MVQIIQRRVRYIRLWHLWAMALILRLLYLLLALSNQSLESLSKSIPDTVAYISTANYFLHNDSSGLFWVFQVGPGYGLILAIIFTVFDSSICCAYIFNIIMGSLAPVFIYLFAYQLTEKRSVSLLAGIFSVFSPTSITLSSNLLTDQPFFTFFAASLFLYVKGIKSLDNKWLILSGIIAGIASYLRATVILWPLIFFIIPFLIPHYRKKYSYSYLARKAGIVSVIFLIFILAWSFRNLLAHDIFAFGGNGVKCARLRWAALTVANHLEDADYNDIRIQWSKEDSIYFNGRASTYAEQYKRELSQTMQIFKNHPDWMILRFFENVKSNLYTGNFIPRTQVPVLLPLWGFLIQLNKGILTHLLLLFSFVGAILFFFDKNYVAGIVLTTTFLYFTFITGLSFWQGTRLHYPAEMAWAVLIAYALHRFYSLRRVMVAYSRKQVLSLKRKLFHQFVSDHGQCEASRLT
jgi:hypothetical protein